MIPPRGLKVTRKGENSVTLTLRISDAAWKAALIPLPTVFLAALYAVVGDDGWGVGGATRRGIAIAAAVSGSVVTLWWRYLYASRLDISGSTIRVIGVFGRAEFDVNSVKRIERPGTGRNHVSMLLVNGSRVSVGALLAEPETNEYVGHLIEARKRDGGAQVSTRKVNIAWRP
ncbi:hypothetical protein [Streptomyces sp. NPDC049944]|uniref:hypothetical protein n=1 Tax=Streptomyces sp. NPDC049944 TaxID=3155657 RepID=UPI003431B35A